MHTFTLTLLASIGAIVIYAIASYILAGLIKDGTLSILDFDDADIFSCLCAAQAIIATISITLYFCIKYM